MLRGQTLALAREAEPRTHNDSSVTVTQEKEEGRGGGRGLQEEGESSSLCRPPPSKLHQSAPAAAGAYFLFFMNGSKVTAAAHVTENITSVDWLCTNGTPAISIGWSGGSNYLLDTEQEADE